MKRAIQEAVKLSHIDINRKLYASAVTVETAYVLAQRKDEEDERKGYNNIPIGSTTLKRTRVQYFQLEAEALRIVRFLTKEDNSVCRAQKITIYNDAKNMGTFMKSDMNNRKNPRLFKMLDKTMMYIFR